MGGEVGKTRMNGSHGRQLPGCRRICWGTSQLSRWGMGFSPQGFSPFVSMGYLTGQKACSRTQENAVAGSDAYHAPTWCRNAMRPGVFMIAREP